MSLASYDWIEPHGERIPGIMLTINGRPSLHLLPKEAEELADALDDAAERFQDPAVTG